MKIHTTDYKTASIEQRMFDSRINDSDGTAYKTGQNSPLLVKS